PVSALTRKLGRGIRAEHERDVVAAELSRKLSAFCEQLERRARRPAAHRLDERPAVVLLRRRLLTEPFGLVPARRLRTAVRCELADPRDGRIELGVAVARALRRH